MNARELSNKDLYNKYDGKRGEIATEMCRRVGTIVYLLEYCAHDDKKFESCMRDTIYEFKNLLKEDRKYKKY